MTRSIEGELVKDVFTRAVKACGPDDTLAEAAALLWTFDCGLMPVVDDARKLLGVVTDRDICMAVATRDQRASQLRLREVMAGDLAVCGPDDALEAALARMARARVRRLPVVDPAGALLGILSISDVVRRGRDAAALETLRAICEPRKEDSLEEIGSPAATTTR
jgi:CBS domain-containing protein